jgi:hypothetical protein
MKELQEMILAPTGTSAEHLSSITLRLGFFLEAWKLIHYTLLSSPEGTGTTVE